MNAVATAESVVETHALEGIDWTVLAQETVVSEPQNLCSKMCSKV